jgi:26S proteasome regulatory subunit N6
MASVDAAMEVDEKEVARNEEMKERLEQGKAFHLASKAEQAEAAYKSVMAEEGDGEEFNKLKEQAICKLGELYADNARVKDIQQLMVSIRPFFANIPKAKTAKIVRTLIELVAKVSGSNDLQMQLCLETIEWCKQEKRTFLRHRIQAKLAAMYFENRDFTRAMALTDELLREVKKLDDKPLLVEIHLVESRTHHQVRNMPKVRKRGAVHFAVPQQLLNTAVP